MPLINHWFINDHSSAAIWEIDEPEDFFVASTGIVSPIAHPKRRTEHVAGRYLLQQLAPSIVLTDIAKDEHDKPRLPNNSLYFSISHSWPYVAAMVSTEAEAGIDIQTYQMRIQSIKDRFLSQAEQTILRNDPELYLLGWAAKEAAYKWNGRRNVAFKEQLPIQSLHDNNTLHISVHGDAHSKSISVAYLKAPTFACAYVEKEIPLTH